MKTHDLKTMDFSWELNIKMMEYMDAHAVSKKHDWLGLCLDMMSEYLPVEVETRADAKKYWEINEHLICILELSGLTQRPGTSEKADERNDFLKHFIRIFNLQIAAAATSDTDGIMNFDNVALNNILLFSLMVNSQEPEFGN
jgi:hypothetical protein